MVDTKLSALPDIGAPTDLDELYVNDGGVSKKMTMNALVAYIESRARQNNASVANQAGFAADTYLTGSDVLIPTGRAQVKTMYRCRFNVTKTAAGVATPILSLRTGTTATVASDPARQVFTFSAGTAAVDEGWFEVLAAFRTVGATTTATLQATARITHRLATTGLVSAGAVQVVTPAVSAGFDSTVAGLRIGLSVNGGASAAWTVNLVQAELYNLA